MPGMIARGAVMKIDENIYRYVEFIYRCDCCASDFVIWMTSKKEWKAGAKRVGFGPKKKLCKPCFEEFNPNPKYETVDEYIAGYKNELTNETKAALKALWDLPPALTPEEREENLEHICGSKTAVQAWRAKK
jgi:hypothetical protein